MLTVSESLGNDVAVTSWKRQDWRHSARVERLTAHCPPQHLTLFSKQDCSGCSLTMLQNVTRCAASSLLAIKLSRKKTSHKYKLLLFVLCNSHRSSLHRYVCFVTDQPSIPWETWMPMKSGEAACMLCSICGKSPANIKNSQKRKKTPKIVNLAWSSEMCCCGKKDV